MVESMKVNTLLGCIVSKVKPCSSACNQGRAVVRPIGKIILNLGYFFHDLRK